MRRGAWLISAVVLSGLGLVAVVVWWLTGGRTRETAPFRGMGSEAALTEMARRVLALEEREAEIAKSVWAKELLSRRCGEVAERLWDDINRSTNRLAILESLVVGAIVIPEWELRPEGIHGIRVYQARGGGRSLQGGDAWRRTLSEWRAQGWDLEKVELRHLEFEANAAGQPLRSRFFASGHLTRGTDEERAILEGDVVVAWRTPADSLQAPLMDRIDARGLVLKRRAGPPVFRSVLQEELAPPQGSFFIDPLMVYDLDGDGLLEVILAARNVVFRRNERGEYAQSVLCQQAPGLIFTGLLGDLDGDGRVDLLCAKFEGLYLYRGGLSGRFEGVPEKVWSADQRLRYAQCLTCGDVDADGDLDVWLGQYKLPYDRGQMPTPYYDALDGYPSYLLINDGRGGFREAPASAGLQAKRLRRAYSGSLVDLDGDGDLDLAVASDFAGLDLYANDGTGSFRDVTQKWLKGRYAFGMSQICSDFNRDGVIDLLMVGMNVPVMERLSRMGQSRPGYKAYVEMGLPMAEGNRLFLGTGGGPMEETSLAQSIRRSGWSWGAGVLDADNDGFPEVYIANGHETKEFVRDYETEFWLHDIYVGTSQDDPVAAAYFQRKYARTRAKGMSYGGYEKNRFYWNLKGGAFLEAGYLMGVGLEEDSRNVVGEDWDEDGREDILMTTFEVWPRVRQTFRVFRNGLEGVGNWVGLRFREEAGRHTPTGAAVTLVGTDGSRSVRAVVAGDGYRSQRSLSARFGIGSAVSIDRVEVRWVGGETTVLKDLPLNRYHWVKSPPRLRATERDAGP